MTIFGLYLSPSDEDLYIEIYQKLKYFSLINDSTLYFAKQIIYDNS